MKNTKMEMLKKIAEKLMGKNYVELTYTELMKVNRVFDKAVNIQSARAIQGWL